MDAYRIECSSLYIEIAVLFDARKTAVLIYVQLSCGKMVDLAGKKVAAPFDLMEIDEDTTKRLVRYVLRQATFGADCYPNEDAYSNKYDVFFSVSIPGIEWDEYIDRVYKYTGASDMCFIIAFILISRCKLAVNVFNAHRLFITSLTVAIKYLDDRVYEQNFYARIGGLNGGAVELNRCELQFLSLIDFQVYVPLKELQTFIMVNSFLSKVRARL